MPSLRFGCPKKKSLCFRCVKKSQKKSDKEKVKQSQTKSQTKKVKKVKQKSNKSNKKKIDGKFRWKISSGVRVRELAPGDISVSRGAR